MRLVDWARRQGISYKTAWRWVKDDMMPVPWRQTSSGTILVDAPADDLPAAVALYARVSSHDQRRDLDRQLARLSQYAAEHKLHVVETAAEVGSGLNGTLQAVAASLRRERRCHRCGAPRSVCQIRLGVS